MGSSSATLYVNDLFSLCTFDDGADVAPPIGHEAVALNLNVWPGLCHRAWISPHLIHFSEPTRRTDFLLALYQSETPFRLLVFYTSSTTHS